MISREKWHKGQLKEREHHNLPYDEGLKHYAESYRHYFRYLNIDKDLKGKSVIEVGSADFPGLNYCNNFGKSFIIEPMPSDILMAICSDKGINLLVSPAEDLIWPKVDEVWFMNVLQHVLDPDLLIEKAKESSRVIRWFEPIETPVDSMHHHSFTMDYFKRYFGSVVSYYGAGQKIDNFHTWQNCFGIYHT